MKKELVSLAVIVGSWFSSDLGLERGSAQESSKTAYLPVQGSVFESEKTKKNAEAGRLPHSSADGVPSEIRILASSQNGNDVYASPVNVVVGKKVVLHAVAINREGNQKVMVAPRGLISKLKCGMVSWGDKKGGNREWNQEEVKGLHWYKVEPQEYCFSNTFPNWHWHNVPFQERLIADGVESIVADAVPTNFRGGLLGCGVMRYKVEYKHGSCIVKTPGASVMDPAKKCSGVFQVSFRGGTPYEIINHAMGLGNVPYIYGSSSPTGKDTDHQTEWGYASDCADFVTFAARKAGYGMGYGFTGSFEPGVGRTRLIARIAKPEKLVGGLYTSKSGALIKWNKEGVDGVNVEDLVLWRGHIGILYQDRGKKGVLDENDMVLHHLFGAPAFAPLGSAYGGEFSIVRLKPELKRK